MLKRAISYMLIIAMVCAMVPSQAFATEITKGTVSETTESTTAPARTTEETVEMLVETEEVNEEANLQSSEVTSETTAAVEGLSTESDITETVFTEVTVPVETEESTEETIPEASLDAAATVSGTCGSALTWELSDEGVLTIFGSGLMYDYEGDYEKRPWHDYRSRITSAVIESGVTSIGSCAFYELSALSSVSIPDSITSIGNYAFSYCSSLNSVTIPDGVASIGDYLFYNCTDLASVTIPHSVTSIGYDAFAYCYRLTSIFIPESVTFIDDCAFFHCTGLSNVTIPSSVISIGDSVFSGCTSLISTTIPDSITYISSYMFSNCTKLTGVTIPDSVTYIGKSAFESCSNLTSVTIPDSVTRIDGCAFYNCDGLTTMYIPESVTSIGSNAFMRCDKLRAVYIPSSVSTIYASSSSDGPFYYCSARPVLYCGAASKPVGWGNYWRSSFAVKWNVSREEGAFWTGDAQKSDVVIPDYVTSIPGDAFYNRTDLTSITIPCSVTSIGKNAFYNCNNLRSVYIPESVTSISAASVADSPFYGGSSRLTLYCGVASEPHGWEDYWNYNGVDSTLTVKWNSTQEESDFWIGDAQKPNVVIPDFVTSIPEYAFYNRTDLISITISDNVTSIGGYAFYGCSGLTSVNIPERITSIGAYAFYNCSSLTDVNISDLAAWCGISFTDNYANPLYCAEVLKLNGQTITNLVIPEDVTCVSSLAFYGCNSLTSVKIPDTVTEIGDGVFYNCNNLERVLIPDSVKVIGESAFYNCSNDMIIYCMGITKYIDWKLSWNLRYSQFIHTDYYRYYYYTVYWAASEAEFNYWNTLDKTVESIIVPDYIFRIHETAYQYCSNLKSVYIHDGVLRIEADSQWDLGPFIGAPSDAVIYCEAESKPVNWEYCWNNYADYDSSLLTVNWGCTLNDYLYWTAFDNSGSNIVLKDGITMIPIDAFNGCMGLTNITIPASVVAVGEGAFDNCSDSLSICYRGTKEQWIATAESGGKTICSDGTVYGWGNCGYYFPEYNSFDSNVKWMLDDTHIMHITGTGNMYGSSWYPNPPWENCKDYIVSVSVEDGVTSIGLNAFYDCVNLTAVMLPETITFIDSYAFGSNENLTTINIPVSVTYIGDSAFSYCSKANGLRIPNGVTHIGQNAFSGCDTLTSVVIPEGVTAINDYTFSNCDNLREVTIPEGVTSIGKSAFYRCSIDSIALPEGLESIGEYAFANCSNLTGITIPRSVDLISNWAFGMEEYEQSASLREIIFRHGANDSLLISAKAFYTYSYDWQTGSVVQCKTTVKVPVASSVNPAISGYDWAGSNREVDWDSHNCMNDHYETTEGGIPATCTEDGFAGRIYCAACGITISENTVLPALGHQEVEDAAVAATCTTSGLTTGSHCSRCNEVLIVRETIPALGHAYVSVPAVEPTCTSNGLTEGRICSRCADVQVFQETVSALGHAAVTDPAVSATCTDPGLTQGSHCSRCGEILVAQTTIPALGHREVPIGNRIEPTCTETGLTAGVKCSVCNVVLTAQETIAMLPHSLDNNSVCTVCGNADLLGSGTCGTNVTWKLGANGLLTISGSGAMKDYSYSGAQPWYSNRSRITAVRVESGVTSVGSYAFYNCDSLTTVTMADTVTSIGQYAFYDCDAISCVTAAAVTYSSRGVSAGVGIPNSVTDIGNYAFRSCDSLTEVTIPNGVTGIGIGAFSRCAGLKAIRVSSYNYSYVSDTYGVLYNRAMTRLIQAPGGISGTYTIKDSVAYIYDSAFSGCAGLSGVTIPEGVVSIGDSAFTGCTGLISVEIPDSVTDIGDNAFSGCTGLTGVTIGIGVPQNTFYNCKNLSRVVFHEGITEIGKDMLGSITLKAVYIPASVQTIAQDAFRGSPTFYCVAPSQPDSWEAGWNNKSTVYYDCAPMDAWFWGRRDLSEYTGIRIPDGVTLIPRRAFYNYDNLNWVRIPNTVTQIYSEAFRDCSALEDVYIPDSVTTFGEDVFEGTRFYNLEIHYDGNHKQWMSLTLGKYKATCWSGGECSIRSKGDCGPETKWALSNSGILVIYGSGATFDWTEEETPPWEDYASSITTLIIKEGVTAIGDYAFSSCNQLQDITIPASIAAVGEYAFKKTITVDICDLSAWCAISFENRKSNPARRLRLNGEVIEDLVIPEGVTTIGDYAFYDIDNLISVTIPESIRSIGRSAFDSCGALEEVHIKDVAAWCAIDFESFSSNPVYYAKHIALDGEEIVDLVIPEGVSAIGDYAFYGWRGREGTRPRSVTIPGSVTSIGTSAFSNVYSLETVYVRDLAAWCAIDFENQSSNPAAVARHIVLDGEEILDLVIPEGITEIKKHAFYSLDSITSVTIPDSVTGIGSNAFQGCSKLENILFRGSAPLIDGSAFSEVTAFAWYPGGDGTWTKNVQKNYGGMLSWRSDYAAQVQILDQDGENVAGTTVWVDLNAGPNPMTFSATTLPEVAEDTVVWKYETSNCSEVNENGNGTITVTSTGTAGIQTITAEALDGSGAKASVTVKFVSLTVGKEELPGEDPADVNLLSGKAKQLTILNADTGKPLTAKEVTWSMDEIFAPYAKIDAKGKLTAKKVVEKVRVEAMASIIGSAGTTVCVTVDIYPAVTKVELFLEGELRNDKTVPVDQIPVAMEISANIYPLDAMDGVTWTISDKKEAFATYEIRNNILMVTPKENAKPGTVTIKATSADGSKKTATVKLQFGTYAQTVTIDKSITTLTAGDKAVQLTATMTPDVVTKSGIVWSLKNAADKSYVTLSSAGKITPKAVLAPVDVTIVATSKDGMASDEHTIRILPKAAAQLVLKSGDVYVTKTTQTLDVNTQQSITISAHTYGEEAMTEVTWSPLANKAANITVNDDGSLTVQMIAAGSINITAKTADRRSAAVTVKGVQLAQALEISQKKTGITEGLEVASGKSLDLQATLTNAANKKVTWSIAEGAQFASVSNSGKVTANKNLTSGGSVIVRATAADGSGATNTIAISVRPIAQGVQVYSESGGRMLFSFRTTNWWVRSNTTLNWDLSAQADTIAMTAHVYPYYGEDNTKNAIQAVIWKSSVPKIAEFAEDTDGNISLKLHKTGSATITATAADGSNQKVTFKLNVIKSVTSLTIGNQTVQSGKNINLAKLLTINPSDATNKKLNWKITKGSEYATIVNGNFKAKKVTAAKTVEVTISSQDGGASTKVYVTITP